MTSDLTFMVPDWGMLPEKYRHDCMEQIAPGIYRHLRLGVTFVIEEAIRYQEETARYHVLTDAVSHFRPGETPEKVIANLAVSTHGKERKITAIKQYRDDVMMVFGVTPSLHESKRAIDAAFERLSF